MSFPLPAARPWLARRRFPVLATAGPVAAGMAATTWWGPGLPGKHSWMVPHDLLRTLVAAFGCALAARCGRRGLASPSSSPGSRCAPAATRLISRS